jgi:hypothetical protein
VIVRVCVYARACVYNRNSVILQRIMYMYSTCVCVCDVTSLCSETCALCWGLLWNGVQTAGVGGVQ